MNQQHMQQGPVPQKDFLPRLGAGCVVLLGAFMAFAGMGLLIGEEGDVFGFIFCMFIAAGFTAAGIFWYRYATSQERGKRALFEEKAILGIAARNGGYTTLAQVTLETPFTSAESEAAMARLCREGFAQPELMDDGTVRYRFGGLLGKDEG